MTPAKRVLLVFGALRHGGLQTLIVRIANFLASHGRTVAACVSGGDLVGEIGSGVDILCWADRGQAIRKAIHWINDSSEPVMMITFDPISAALGLAIEVRNSGRTQIVHISGVYHPRSFFMTGERYDRILLNRLVAAAVGDGLIFYMNAECRAEHERRWGARLAGSAIIPLPIEERSSAWEPVASDRLRIVSVGRLVDFKAYNLAAPQLARECKEAGISLSWDIYGTGPYGETITRAIAATETADFVRLRGNLEYLNFVETVVGYDLFIGMGTAALEAAMVGVPTIVATEGERRRSYGFVDQLPFGNVGERQASPTPFDLGDLIQAYAAMEPLERAALSNRCRESVRPYRLDCCVAALDRLAAETVKPPSTRFKRAVSALYEGVTASRAANLARLARRLVRPRPTTR